MTVQTASRPPIYGNEVFEHGFSCGISWFERGETATIPPTVEQIVEFIRGNMLEPQAEGWLDEERLVDYAGFLTGWIVGQYL